jgi:hypothetical protein
MEVPVPSACVLAVSILPLSVILFIGLMFDKRNDII